MIEGRALIPVSTGRPVAHICVHCVGVCDSLFEQHQRKNAKLEKMPTPCELVAHLNEYIIGQERVK
jgi:ATP-dependent Clp protease ATP-binding subunit ClpX